MDWILPAFLLLFPHLVAMSELDCSAYPFFSHSHWGNLAKDSNVSMVADGEEYFLRVELPVTLEAYLASKEASVCLDQSTPRKFTIWAQLGWDGQWFKYHHIKCKYSTLGEISGETVKQCKGGRTFDFLIQQCGVRSLKFLGEAYPDGETFRLGEVRTVNLPFYTKLLQTEKTLTSAKLEFDPKMRSCFPQRTYSVKCGAASNNKVREDSSVSLDKLFPGQSYTCTYRRNGHDQTQTVTLETEPLDFGDISPFSVHDKGIFLAHTKQLASLMGDQNILITVTVTDLDTNRTISAPGQVAAESGITGLSPTKHYQVCLGVAQLESHYDVRNETWCHRMMTLPPMSSSHSGSITGLWVVVVLLVLIVLGFAVLHFLRPNVASAVRSIPQRLKISIYGPD